MQLQLFPPSQLKGKGGHVKVLAYNKVLAKGLV